jgi:hypothetical protein
MHKIDAPAYHPTQFKKLVRQVNSLIASSIQPVYSRGARVRAKINPSSK